MSRPTDPVPPPDPRDLARQILQLFLAAERSLLALVARLFARSGTPAARALRVQDLRRAAQPEVTRLVGQAAPLASQAARLAYEAGTRKANDELSRPDRPLPAQLRGQRPAQLLADTAAGQVRDLAVPVLRATEDIYRQLVAQDAAAVASGELTRRQASARLVSRMAERGLVFVDKAGRQWEAGAYAEMAIRTAASQAMLQGQLDRLQDAGHDLVRVSDAPEECEKCRPWEGRVLSITGRTVGTVTGRSPLGGEETVYVRGSIAEAKAAGLFHPNCRHSISLYIPGVTKLPMVLRAADPEGDKLRQRQRYLERVVRARRRQLATVAELRRATAAAAGRKALAATDPVEVEYRRVRALERAATARHDQFVKAHDRKRLAYRMSPAPAR